ncbi:MAG: phosphatase domain-containing protein [Myxococcota bacterium]
MRIFRWDLDRTYLDTDIHSVRGMLRTALETAADKRTVPGAAPLLRGLVSSNPDCRVAILSGSPEQLRQVLEEKLNLDGIPVDSLTLKDNLGNITRGRWRAIRGQLGYKLPALLEARRQTSLETRESLFGDNSEVDAAIYVLYAEALAGQIDARSMRRVLRKGGAYDDQVSRSLEALHALPKTDAVDDIFIHLDRGHTSSDYDLLGRRVTPVHSWVQAAMVLAVRGRLHAHLLPAVADSCVGPQAPPERMAALVQDAVRRHLLAMDEARALLEQLPDTPRWQLALRFLDDLNQPPPDTRRETPDYAAFLATR